MKIAIKLLKGEIFHVEAEGSDTVADVKNRIQEARSELDADRQKLIHLGKVLKDTQTVSETGVSEADFFVCMVTKDVAKPKAPTAAPAAAPVAAPAPAVTSTPIAAPRAASPPAVARTTSASTQPPPAPIPMAPVGGNSQFVTPEALAALTGMGFPEAECRVVLQAAMGNPDLAYEFLLTGIPEHVRLAAAAPRAAAPAAAPSPAAAAPASAGAEGIQQFRSHPQFNMLKQLIQQNPAALPQVLTLIGQQNPALLQAIHANQDEFVRMMNEPIGAPAPAPAAAPVPAAVDPSQQGARQMPMPNPAQLMQLLAAIPPAQRDMILQGSPQEQMAILTQLMGALPPQALAQLMGGAGGIPPQQQGIALTHDEMESVNRLMALGFSQAQAAQAFVACDRNENLAANFLFENGWGDEGEEFGGDGGEGGDEDDHMYG